MSVYIECGGTTYSNIKSVSFVPEYDPTLATLPVCEFEVNVVTSTAPEDFAGKKIDLHEDLGYTNATNTLLAGWYEVAETEYSEPGVVRIRAQSLLAWLDKRTLAGEYFNGLDFETFVKRLFTDTPIMNNQPVWNAGSFDPDTGEWEDEDPPVTFRSAHNADRVYGWCPEQTARERLQMVCQSQMMRVVQYGVHTAAGLYITNSPDGTNINDPGTHLIELHNTFFKPVVKRTSEITGCSIIKYSNFRTTERTGEYWDSVVTQEGWEDSQTGISQPEERLYFLKTARNYSSGADDTGSTVEIKDNMLMYWETKYEGIPATYFRRYEVEADVLQIKYSGGGEYVWPGDRVWFYIDEQTICKGVIKSAAFTFGKLARAKLVISTDLVPVATGTLEAVYQYYGGGSFHAFMRKTYRLPPYVTVNIPVPRHLSCWEGAKVRHFEASGSSGWSIDTGPAAGQTKTTDIYYNRMS